MDRNVRIKSWTIIFLLLIGLQGVGANRIKGRYAIERDLRRVEKVYSDSLKTVVERYAADTLIGDVDVNGRYYRLFAPPTLYTSVVNNSLAEPALEQSELYEVAELPQLELKNSTKLFYSDLLERQIDAVLLDACLEYPDYFCYTEEQVRDEQVVTAAEVAELAPMANIIPEEGILPQMEGLNVTGVELEVKKPNFWKTAGNMTLQFTQNYISGNWYKGGESTNTLVSGFTFDVNYDDKQKLQFDNRLEMKLGFTTAPSDTMHRYRTNTDLIRVSSKLGLRAFKAWYYTVGLDVNTQLLRNYKTNSNSLQSAFISPLRLTLNVGMDYKKTGKNYNVSVTLSPLAYQWTYVGDRNVDETKFDVDKGNRVAQYFGSSMKTTSKWTIHKNITWESRLDAFTNYEKVEASWENTFNFNISKYLSTQLFLHGRFDDAATKKKGYSYFQFKEFLSFGLQYNW